MKANQLLLASLFCSAILAPACNQDAPGDPSEPEICNDAADNDLDGLTDCDDDDCTLDLACAVPERCDSGEDEDLDGLTDCDDDDCALDLACATQELCSSGKDEDLDGLTDCDDSDCLTAEACICEPTTDGVIEVNNFPFIFDGVINADEASVEPSNIAGCKFGGERVLFSFNKFGSVDFEITSADADLALSVLDTCEQGFGASCSGENFKQRADISNGLVLAVFPTPKTLGDTGSYRITITDPFQ